MRWSLAFAAFAVLGVAVVFGEDANTADVPESVRAAVERAQQTQDAADVQWDRTMLAAKQSELVKLKDAKASAERHGNIGDAKAIEALIDGCNEFIKTYQPKLEGLLGRYSFAVQPTGDWQKVVDAIPKGTYVVAAVGRVTVESDGIKDINADGIGNTTLSINGRKLGHVGQLVGTVCDEKSKPGHDVGAIQSLGQHGELLVTTDGALYMRFLGVDADKENNGEITVMLVRK